MSKVIDYDKIVRESFIKAQRDLGLHKELAKATVLKEEEQSDIYDILDSIKFRSEEWGRKETVGYSELEYFSKNLRRIAGVTGAGSIDNFSQIIEKINSILGYREAKEGSRSKGYAEETGEGAENINELTTTLYFANIMHSIILKQTSASVSGGVWEGFFANLLGGELAAKQKVSPIQDIIDESGNYVSLKVIGKNSAVTGSKYNLAVAVATKNNVHYLVAIKTSNDPFKIVFKKFLINKNNFFAFITGNPNAVSGNDVQSWSEDARDNYAALLSKARNTPTKLQTTAATSPASQTAAKPAETEEISLEKIYKEEAKQIAKAQGISVEQATKLIKDRFITKIIDITTQVAEPLEQLKVLFPKFIEDDQIKFGKIFKPIDLRSREAFIASMIDFWLFKGDEKFFKETAYDKFIRTFLDSVIEIPDPEDTDLKAKLELIQRYDISDNSLLKRIENMAELDNVLKQYDRNLINSITSIDQDIGSKLQNKSFSEIYYEVEKLPNSDKNLKIKNITESSYNSRKEVYRKKHKIFFEDLKKVLNPFIEWYSKLSKAEDEKVKQAAKQSAKTVQDTYPDSTTNSGKALNEFWQSFVNAPLESDEQKTELEESLIIEGGKGASSSNSSFSLRLSTIREVADVDESISDFIISKVGLKQVAQANTNSLREYIKPYYDALNKVTQGTREYFVGDDPNGMVKVNEGMEDIKTAQTKLKTDTGQFKKASSIKEMLNMTREAAIVLEMLQRMED